MKVLFLLFALISNIAWSKVNLELIVTDDQVKQGEIIPARLIVKESQGQVALSGLKGQKFAKTLYLMNLSHFMGKQGTLESDAKVIFMAIPSGNSVTETINGEEVSISWNAIQVQPTEEVKSFLLGDFEVPERKDLLSWLFGLLGLGIIAFVGIWVRRKLLSKKLAKNKLLKTKEELLTCKSYEDIVLMWRQKHKFLQTFPQLEEAFKNFESVLFKYQFKPERTASELDDVQDAYQRFKAEVTGVLNGI